ALQGARAADWQPGDEAEIFDHTFAEEMWTVDNLTKQIDGKNVTFAVSYVNHSGAQAFLVALVNVTDGDYVSTLPYQLFGMHYMTPAGQEVFVGAVFAFLLAYEDTYNGTGPGNNGMPDPGNENVFYVIPFGVGEVFDNRSYRPEVEVLPVEKLGDGHYRFGMRYRNLYAKIIDANNPLGFLLSLNFPLYIAKFSEFTIVYDVTIDPASGTMKAETYYSLGQVSDLWVFGIPATRADIPFDFGISVVHYVAMFTSSYTLEDATGLAVDTGIQRPLDEDLTIRVGDRAERALQVGFRGTFNLTDEVTDQRIQEDTPAYNILVLARPGDLILVRWQAAFSLHLMAAFAFGLSGEIRGRYDSPTDLILNGSEDFTRAAFWYAVAFPNWRGYRVDHDPTYTAFFAPAGQEAPAGVNPAGLVALGLAAFVAVAAVFLVRRRRRARAGPEAPDPTEADAETKAQAGDDPVVTEDDSGPLPEDDLAWPLEDDFD
ncbi:MAG: hypothetical protein ACE5JE_08910, partial [Thermoplasmata archaeon]